MRRLFRDVRLLPERSYQSGRLPLILCLILVITVLSRPFLVAQPADRNFVHFTTSEGLSQSWVTCITQDTLGFLWVGTAIGLNRFDGQNFAVYMNNENDSTSLRDNAIWSMLVDSKGRLWIGTATGLDRYDFEMNTFIHYRSTPVRNRTISQDVRSIVEDNDGNIWLATSEGIAAIDLKTATYTVQYFPPQPTHIITSMLIDSFGVLWLSTRNGGLFTFDRARRVFQPFDLHYKVKPQPEDVEMQLSHVYEDSDGELWVATDAGLSRFDRSRHFVNRYQHDEAEANTVADNRIHHVTEDATANLWIAHSNGVSVLNKDRNGFLHYKFSPDNPNGPNNHYLTFVYKDRSANLWFGTRNAGLNVLFSTGTNFKLYRHRPGDMRSLSNNVVKAVLHDANGSYWFGTDGGGLNEVRADGTFQIYMHDPKDPSTLPNDLVLSIYEDTHGYIWVGTFGGALSVLNRRLGNFTHFLPDLDHESKLRSASVSVMYEDRKGNFWVGTWYGGLHLFDRQKKTFKRFPFKVVDGSGISDEKVLDILETKDGTLIIGTGNGLNVYHRDAQEFNYFFNQDSIETSISGNVCNSICEDVAGRVWIGTDNGLSLFDRQNSTFRKFGTRDGLPSESIQGVLADADGNLWISTLNGISRFNVDSKSVRNYDVDAGLQGREFVTHSYFKNDAGVMIFGGNNGVNVIDPSIIVPNKYVPPVVFTGLKIMNKPVTAGKHKALARQLPYQRELRLSHDEAFFTLEFAALNFTNAKSNQYAYFLEGIDRDWNYIGNERSVTYNGLPPGEYVFRVKASNNDGVWNEKGASLTIRITPPIWQTLWFRILGIASFIALVLVIFYVRVRTVKKQKEALERLVVKRTREIQHQKEEIETQKENIIGQVTEIAAKNKWISEQNVQLEAMRREVKEKNDQLERYNAELESTVKKRTKQLSQMNEELDQFVYRSAHDLKGPVSRIMGLSYLYGLEQPDQRSNQYVQLVNTCTEEMNRKLGRLMSIHELNKHEIRLDPVDCQHLIAEVIAVVSQEQKTDVIFKVNCENHSLRSDRDLLYILLKNIIENAVKFRDKSKPESYVRICLNKIKTGTLITISDNGVGISPKHVSRIFDMFVVCNDSIKGFGLGLYEAKLVARRLNARLRVKLKKNGETEFRILLRERKNHQDKN